MKNAAFNRPETESITMTQALLALRTVDDLLTAESADEVRVVVTIG
jgi:hypothetical protein